MPEESLEVGDSQASPVESSGGSRENGQRPGLRFRRGSRGLIRTGEIPLIGVVELEQPAEPARTAETMAGEGETTAPAGKPKATRPRRSTRKKAAATAPVPAGEAPTGDTASVSRPKRPRTRSRKKAE